MAKYLLDFKALICYPFRWKLYSQSRISCRLPVSAWPNRRVIVARRDKHGLPSLSSDRSPPDQSVHSSSVKACASLRSLRIFRKLHPSVRSTVQGQPRLKRFHSGLTEHCVRSNLPVFLPGRSPPADLTIPPKQRSSRDTHPRKGVFVPTTSFRGKHR